MPPILAAAANPRDEPAREPASAPACSRAPSPASASPTGPQCRAPGLRAAGLQGRRPTEGEPPPPWVLEVSAPPVPAPPPLGAAIFKARQNVERAAPSARWQELILSAPYNPVLQPEPRLRVCPAGNLSGGSGAPPPVDTWRCATVDGDAAVGARGSPPARRSPRRFLRGKAFGAVFMILQRRQKL